MDGANVGAIVAVRGSIVDACFPASLPALKNELHLGDHSFPSADVVIEVAAHLDAQTVRGIALTPTRGLARGMTVTDTGHLLRAPVGRATLGRMFNVFG